MQAGWHLMARKKREEALCNCCFIKPTGVKVNEKVGKKGNGKIHHNVMYIPVIMHTDARRLTIFSCCRGGEGERKKRKRNSSA